MMNLNMPLDLSDSASTEFLKRVQGNTLKAHSREFARLLFVELGIGGGRARESLTRGIWNYGLVTSAHTQRTQSARHKAGDDSGPFASIAISRAGYSKLGAECAGPSNLDTLRSMKDKRKGYDWGTDVDRTWTDEFKKANYHLLILLADDRHDRLDELTERARIWLSAELDARVHIEEAKRRIHSKVDPARPLEHFGFRDAISGPKFIKQEARPRNVWPRWSEATPLGRLFEQERRIEGRGDTYGSFVAFLKLEQNVRKFQEDTKDLAKKLGVEWCDERAQALTMGRWPDGAPIVRSVGLNGNDFNFRGENRGQCPVHAHIRRMNKRPPSGHFMARRSMNYGDRPDLEPGPSVDAPVNGVGLLFLSYQNTLNSFESALVAARRPHDGGAVDPIMGGSFVGDVDHAWEKWDQNRSIECKMADFVKILGGEFFFAPSIPFFENLAKM